MTNKQTRRSFLSSSAAIIPVATLGLPGRSKADSVVYPLPDISRPGVYNVRTCMTDKAEEVKQYLIEGLGLKEWTSENRAATKFFTHESDNMRMAHLHLLAMASGVRLIVFSDSNECYNSLHMVSRWIFVQSKMYTTNTNHGPNESYFKSFQLPPHLKSSIV